MQKQLAEARKIQRGEREAETKIITNAIKIDSKGKQNFDFSAPFFQDYMERYEDPSPLCNFCGPTYGG